MDFVKIPTRAGFAVIRVSSIQEVHDIDDGENGEKSIVYLGSNFEKEYWDETYSTATATEIYTLLTGEK